jgi:hypothetical protein
MIDKKWILGIGASSALAFSALVTPLSAAAQEVNTDVAPTDATTQIDNGLGTISSDQAIDTAHKLVPGAQITNVHLDYLTLLGAPSFNLDFSGADIGSGLGNTTNFTLNMVYVVELENNISVTIDASTGAVVDVDDDDAIVDDEDDGVVDDDDAIVDDEDDGVVDDDDAIVDDEDDAVVDDDDAIVDDEDDAVVDDDDAIVDDEDDAVVDDEENGNGEENGVEDENGDIEIAAFVSALEATEAPVPQAAAYGYRAVQACGGEGGFSAYGFDNQGQCVSLGVALLQAGIDEDDAIVDDEDDGLVDDENDGLVDDEDDGLVDDEDDGVVDDEDDGVVDDEDDAIVDDEENGNGNDAENGNGNGAENGNGNGAENGNDNGAENGNGNGAENGNGNGAEEENGAGGEEEN